MRAMLKTRLHYGVQSQGLPHGATIRHVEAQNNIVCVWFEGDPSPTNQLEHRTFRVAATGEDLEPMDNLSYLGSALCDGGALVWHVYEVLPNVPV